MKKRNKRYDAYFTVEASFIVPMVFLLIILTVQYGFFCYEKSVSVQCCYLASLRAANKWELSESAQKKFAKEEMNILLEQRNLYPVQDEIRIEEMLMEIQTGKSVPSTYIRRLHMVEKLGGEKDGSN